jgi:ATP-dependent DNA ligase
VALDGARLREDPRTAVASCSALPEPMLARSGPLPTSGDYAYELKWDGFRAIVSTEGELPVRRRRGWDMTEHVGFLSDLPVRAVLDGELRIPGRSARHVSLPRVKTVQLTVSASRAREAA